jgi:hypothetical protein
MSLQQNFVETTNECDKVDLLIDLPLDIVEGANWSIDINSSGRFPDPFPWLEINSVYIFGNENICTENRNSDNLVWKIVIASQTNGFGKVCVIHDIKGYKYAQDMLQCFYDKIPEEIKNLFSKHGDKLIKYSVIIP